MRITIFALYLIPALALAQNSKPPQNPCHLPGKISIQTPKKGEPLYWICGSDGGWQRIDAPTAKWNVERLPEGGSFSFVPGDSTIAPRQESGNPITLEGGVAVTAPSIRMVERVRGTVEPNLVLGDEAEVTDKSTVTVEPLTKTQQEALRAASVALSEARAKYKATTDGIKVAHKAYSGPATGRFIATGCISGDVDSEIAGDSIIIRRSTRYVCGGMFAPTVPDPVK